MRVIYSVFLLIFATSPAIAQEALSDSLPNIPAGSSYQDLIPTLEVDAGRSESNRLNQVFPPLPAIKIAEDPPSNPPTAALPTLTGFILNRQLVERTAREYPPSGVEIGQGWNSFLNRPSSNVCIEGTIQPMPGTHLSADFTSVEDQSSYFEAISGSAGGSYGPFGGSASYSKEKRFSHYDVNIVMSAVVDMGGWFIGPGEKKSVQLSDIALDLLEGDDGVSRFIQACGDSFVTSYRHGGRMSAVLTISNLARADKERIQAEAKGGFGGFSAGASFRKSVESAEANNKLEISFNQVGGAFFGIPSTLNDFVTKFSTYKVDETFNPRRYVFHTQNYRSLSNWPVGLQNRVSPVDQEYYILSYHNFSDFAADYDRAIRSPERFTNFLVGGLPRLKEHRDIALRTARNLDAVIWDCVEKFDCSATAIASWEDEYRKEVLEQVAGIPVADQAGAAAQSAASQLAFSYGLFKGLVEIAPSDGGGSLAVETAPLENPLATEKAPQGDPVILHALVVSHYRLLAGLPILGSSAAAGFTAPSDPDATDDAIVGAFKEWLIANRLRPAAQPYCLRSANHPLCLTDREMGYIISLLEISSGPLKFVPEPDEKPVVAPPPPPPPPITVIKPPPTERPEKNLGLREGLL